jgi:hypothetical protein
VSQVMSFHVPSAFTSTQSSSLTLLGSEGAQLVYPMALPSGQRQVPSCWLSWPPTKYRLRGTWAIMAATSLDTGALLMVARSMPMLRHTSRAWAHVPDALDT